MGIISPFNKWQAYTIGLIVLLVTSLSPVFTLATAIELNEDYSQIVEVRLKRYLLSDALFIYHSNEYTLIPLQEFFDSLEYPINIDVEEEKGNGWYVSQDNQFQLDIKRHEYYINGERFELPDNFKYANDGFSLYVDVEFLEQSFELDMTFYMSRLVLLIDSEIDQPIEQRLLRKNKRKIINKNKEEEVFLQTPDEYKLLNHAQFDVNINQSVSQSQMKTGLWIDGYMDALFHQTHLTVVNQNINEDQFDYQLRLSKKEKSIDQGMWLGVSQYEFGDIQSNSGALTNKSHQGLGLSLSKKTKDTTRNLFNFSEIKGNTNSQWEVELYHNNLLVDFKIADDNGYYHFSDVPEQYGENLYEIYIYGPQGQIEKRIERKQVGKQLLSPKDYSYNLSVIQEDASVQSIFEDSHPIAFKHMHSQFNYGLNAKHSASLSLDSFLYADQQYIYPSISTYSAFKQFSTHVQFSKEISQRTLDALEGSAMYVDVIGRVNEKNYQLNWVQFHNFYSEQSGYASVRHKSTLSYSGTYKNTFIRQLPYSWQGQFSSWENDSWNVKLSNRVALSHRPFRSSNQLSISKTQAEDSLTISGSANTLLDLGLKNGSKRSVRASFSYLIDQPDIQSISVSYDQKYPDWKIKYALDINMINDFTGKASVNVSKKLKYANFSFSGALDEQGQLSVNLILSNSLKTQNDRPFVGFNTQNQAQQGSVNMRVFLDNNGNGQYDKGIDELLSGIGFSGRAKWKGKVTNEKGEVLLSGIDPKKGTVVKIDSITLRDPFLIALIPKQKIFSHAGGIQKIDIAIVQSSEIEGYAYIHKGDKKIGASALVLGLYQNNQLIKKVKTQFDGYYFVSQVIPGDYELRVLDEDILSKKYKWEKIKPFKTEFELGVSYIDDLNLYTLSEDEKEKQGAQE